MENSYQLHQTFLNIWPIERVQQMSLNEYTNLNKLDSFCYWLEAKSQDLGSIWGGSSFKFGIYEKNQKDKNYSELGRLSDDVYAWLSKYGSNREEAFSKIKQLILEIITAAAENDLEKIESIDFGDAYKWKIAFLYSDYKILNVFNKSKLFKIAAELKLDHDKNSSFAKLQNLILQTKNQNEGFFEFGKKVWELTKTNQNKKYWLYSPGEQAYKWDEFFENNIMALGWDELSDLNEYPNPEAIKDGLTNAYGGEGSKKNWVSANHDFLHLINIGDIIIVKKGRRKLLGFGEVTSDYYFDDNREDFKHSRKVQWKLKGNWEVDLTFVMKTLTDITNYESGLNDGKKYYELLFSLMNSSEIRTEDNPITDLLKYKKQIILQGPPGTGKTRLAKEITNEIFINEINNLLDEDFLKDKILENYSFKLISNDKIAKVNKIIGEKVILDIKDNRKELSFTFNEIFKCYKTKDYLNNNFVDYAKYTLRSIVVDILEKLKDEKINNQFKLIQFHPSYTYEDFVRGIVAIPNEKGEGIIYKAEDKMLGKLANDAREDPDNNYVLIIDEINRANLSSVLGELIYALEYRGEEVESMYKVEESQKLILPPNLYIIGTMNTADRSVGHIDYAIRRRFAFVEILPKDLTPEMKEDEFYTDLFFAVKALFTTDDYKTKSDFISQEFEPKDVALGHSYFIDKTVDGGTEKIRWEYEIKPILIEYVRDGVLKQSALDKIQEIEANL